MKILFILPSLSIGGLERVQVTLANALAERGHNVTVMTLGADAELASELVPKVHFIYKPLKPHPIMRRIPYIRHKFYDDGQWETRASAEQLHQYYVGTEKYDVEIGFFRGMPIKIVSGAPDTCIRLAWVHSDFELATGYRNNFRSMLDVFLAYRSFNRVVCVSNQAAAGFRKVIGDTGNLTTIYNLLPIQHIRQLAEQKLMNCPETHEFNISLVGRLLDSAKGQRRLIEVVARLQKEELDIGLTLVGGGPDEAMLRRKIVELHAEGFVHLTGSQSNPYPYIKRADLLVCASYFEGYNLTVAEALILGTPVLSTSCTGPCEILDNGKYGMLVENSTDGLYEGLKHFTTDRTRLDYYRRMTVERMDFFDEEKILRQIETLLQGVNS